MFGLATLVFNGLEMAMHSMMQGAECLTDVVFVHPVVHGLFTFLQMHFLFVNSQASVGKPYVNFILNQARCVLRGRTMRERVSSSRLDASTTITRRSYSNLRQNSFLQIIRKNHFIRIWICFEILEKNN